MKANELRIGNLIYSDGLNSYKKVHAAMLMESDETLNFLYKPIPLTEEWLLKFGFNKEYKKGWIGIDVKYESGTTTDFVLAEPLNMGEWQTYYCFVFDNYRFTGLKYIHQLQNLYFALTGEELTLSE